MDINIEAAFLITEEDFVSMQIARMKIITEKENRVILKIIGIIAAFCGIIAFLYIRGNLYQLISWLLLIAVGLYCLFYYDLINPVITKKQAADRYRFNRREIGSKIFRLDSVNLSFEDEDHKINMPVENIYRLTETSDTLFIFYDMDEFGFIPKRVLDDKQISDMRKFFEEKGKYRNEA